MKTRVINFKDKKIENNYEVNIISLRLPTDWLDKTIEEQEEWYKNIDQYLSTIHYKNVDIILNIDFDFDFDEWDYLSIISKLANCTITDEKIQEYLFIPPWFKEQVSATAEVQKRLGNYKNKFDILQIELYFNFTQKERKLVY